MKREPTHKWLAIVLCIVVGVLANESTTLQAKWFHRTVIGGPMLALLVTMIIFVALVWTLVFTARARKTGMASQSDSLPDGGQEDLPHVHPVVRGHGRPEHLRLLLRGGHRRAGQVPVRRVRGLISNT